VTEVWVCRCEKCGNVVEVTDAELSRRMPWPCGKCGESSVELRPKAAAPSLKSQPESRQ
jgi:NAD-dependent SIR2 family protein deacetylase